MARTGRPKGTCNKEKICSIRMDEKTLIRLELYCKKMGILKSEAIREAIDLLTEKKNTERMMYVKKVFVLYEERENSQLCGIMGVWHTKDEAIHTMRKLISSNPLYSELSEINYEEGFSESDPTYSEEEYSNYSIAEFTI